MAVEGNWQFSLLLWCVIKFLKIAFAFLIGVFFTIATLEIDVCGYDNTFLDPYDSYLQVDSQSIQSSDESGIQNGIESPEKFSISSSLYCTIGPLCAFNIVVISDLPLPKRKLYLVKSSLLI